MREVDDLLAHALLLPLIRDDERLALSPNEVCLSDRQALDLHNQEFAVVDVETTGLALDHCR